MKVLIGALLLALPFIGITALIVRDDGWRTAALVWGFTALLVAPVVAGAWLLAA